MNDAVLVREVPVEVKENGILQKYDSDSTFMFVRVIQINEDVAKNIGIDDRSRDIIVIKRIAKNPFINGTYFINTKDILLVMSGDEFIKMKEGGLTDG